LIGEPVDPQVDIGLAVYQGKDVSVRSFTGTSVLNPGQKTETIEIIERILSPLAQSEVGSIRCIGLNVSLANTCFGCSWVLTVCEFFLHQYVSHAAEMKLTIPDVPTLFLKPSTALADPWPAPTILPKITQVDNTGDYESEMVIVIGRDAKDVSEAEALDYVLGYTAANDVSSRTSQMNQSQWSFSKGFDTSCPIGSYPADFKILRNSCADYDVPDIRTCPCLLGSYPRCQQASNPWLEERPSHAGLHSDV
jgi:hypothetical protein